MTSDNSSNQSCVPRSIKSLLGYLAARPPIAIFILCIAFMALSFQALSLYIQHDNKVINYEDSSVYLSVLSKLSGLTFCLSEQTAQLNETEQRATLLQHGYTEFVNISLPLDASFKLNGNMSHNNSITEVSGLIPYFYILSGDDHVHHIGVRVYLSSPLQPVVCKDEELILNSCVILTIKRDAVPKDLPDSSCDTPKLKRRHSIHMAAINPSKNDKQPLCKKGLEMRIDKKQIYTPTVFLNMLDIAKVTIRLNVVSYGLFVFFITTLLYAILRGSTMNTIQR